MSVREFNLACCPLDLSLQIAFGDHKATHYMTEESRLTFAWTAVNDGLFLPMLVPLTAEAAEPLVREWLKEQAVYPREPDIDGHCGRSWRVFNESWGHVGGKWQAFVAIEPYWAEYHK